MCALTKICYGFQIFSSKLEKFPTKCCRTGYHVWLKSKLVHCHIDLLPSDPTILLGFPQKTENSSKQVRRWILSLVTVIWQSQSRKRYKSVHHKDNVTLCSAKFIGHILGPSVSILHWCGWNSASDCWATTTTALRYWQLSLSFVIIPKLFTHFRCVLWCIANLEPISFSAT